MKMGLNSCECMDFFPRTSYLGLILGPKPRVGSWIDHEESIIAIRLLTLCKGLILNYKYFVHMRRLNTQNTHSSLKKQKK